MVHLSSKKFVNVHKRYEKLVIGGFLEQSLPYQYVKEFLKSAWKLKNDFTMKSFGERMLSFEFVTEEDRLRVLELGCLHIASQLFVVRAWQLFMEAEIEEMKTIPIWVIFKRFPMELWDEEGFSVVGSVVGNPLFTDTLTEERKRMSYARVCVEIDIKCKFPNNVTVVVDDTKGYNLPVEYNWRPPLCKHCDAFGHSEERCSKKQVMSKSTPVWLRIGGVVSREGEVGDVMRREGEQNHNASQQPDEGIENMELTLNQQQLDDTTIQIDEQSEQALNVQEEENIQRTNSQGSMQDI